MLAGDRPSWRRSDRSGSPCGAGRRPTRRRCAAPLALYLGEDEHGPVVPRAGPAGRARRRRPHRPRPGGLACATSGPLLDDAGAGLFTAALGSELARGAPPLRALRQPDRVVQAGWARRCPQCGAEHYPRTDPAVIMAVVDDDDRLLLGRQAALARGAVLDAGRVRRAGGVARGRGAPRGGRGGRRRGRRRGRTSAASRGRSRPSLMLGFKAHALSTTSPWTASSSPRPAGARAEQLAADVGHRRAVMLPPRVSIARRLIEDWYGGQISDATEPGAEPADSRAGWVGRS